MGRPLLLLMISCGLLGVTLSGLMPGVWYPLSLVGGAVAVAFGCWLLATAKRKGAGE